MWVLDEPCSGGSHSAVGREFKGNEAKIRYSQKEEEIH